MTLCAIKGCGNFNTYGSAFCEDHGGKKQTVNNEGIATLLPMSDIGRNNRELRLLRITIIGIVVFLVVGGWIVVDYFNLVDYVAYKFRGGC